MNKTIKFLPLLATGLLAVGCQDYDAGFTEADIVAKKYADKFVQEFGQVDPNQDWSMATLVEANVNLPELQGTAKMNIMTGDPRLSSTRLLAQIMLQDGQGQIQFDAIKGQKNVFVSIVQDGQYKVFGNYEVVNGKLLIGEFDTPSGITRAFSATCPTEKDGNAYEIGISFMPLVTEDPEQPEEDPEQPQEPEGEKVLFLKYDGVEKTEAEWIEIATAAMESSGGNNHSDFLYQYDNYGLPFEKESIVIRAGEYDYNGVNGLDFSNYELREGATSEMKVPTPEGVEPGDDTPATPTESHVKIQYLKNIEKAAAQPWIRGEGYSLYGKDGFFEEYKKYYKTPKIDTYGSTSEAQVEMIKKIETDFEIITEEAGVVSVPFIYGATSNQNQLGYIICDPDEDPLEQTHYVLINDARPNTNIYQGSWKGDDEENKSKGFNGTSIYDSFIKLLKEGDYNPFDHKDDPITCNCTPGSGIWSKAYGTGESDGEDRVGSGVYSPTMKHIGCNDPMQNYIDAYNIPVYGTEYHLSYWDEETEQFTYTVPAGKKIVFFLLAHSTANGKVASTYNDNDFTYSQPSLNKRVHKLYYNEDSPTFETGNNVEGHEKARGAVGSTAWKVGETIYMGFGDGGNDEDLNDLIFVVKGAIRTNELVTLNPIKWHLNYEGKHDTSDQDIWHEENLKVDDPYTQPSNPSREGYEFMGWATTPTGKPIKDSEKKQVISGTTPAKGTCYFAIWKPLNADDEPEPMTWIFACEDLGGTFDYDFNDVVWEVRNNGGQLQARVLAAGGTLDFTIAYNGTGFFTKSTKFGADRVSEVMIQLDVTDADWINVSTVGSDWSITTQNSSQFTVTVVNDGEGDSKIIDRPTGSAPFDKSADLIPEILLVPGDWAWPLESHSIKVAYKDFTTWAYNAENPDWITPTPGEVVTR